MPPLHEILPYVNLALILWVIYVVWKHLYKSKKK